MDRWGKDFEGTLGAILKLDVVVKPLRLIVLSQFKM